MNMRMYVRVQRSSLKPRHVTTLIVAGHKVRNVYVRYENWEAFRSALMRAALESEI